jgi:biopolymer transport protein ExbD
MAGSFGSSGDDDIISGINVTPLVDVVLVLLIMFIMAAPAMYQSAIRIQLPKAMTGGQSEKSPLMFSISKDGTLSWDQKPLDWTVLPARLKALGNAIAQETAIISADEGISHGTVVRLMDELRQAGLTRFALSVENKKL